MALITKDLNSGLTADQLAQFIIGDSGSVVAGTVKFTGNNRAVGTFGGGILEQINVEGGVIFSTEIPRMLRTPITQIVQAQVLI